jgi:hypothetical protein
MVFALALAPITLSHGAKHFCERHKRFMKVQEIVSKLSSSSEKEAMNFLSNRLFTRICQLPLTDDHNNYSTITAWYCPECMNGYISMITKKMVHEQKADGTSSAESKSRSVFSSALNQSEVETILVSARKA